MPISRSSGGQSVGRMEKAHEVVTQLPFAENRRSVEIATSKVMTGRDNFWLTSVERDLILDSIGYTKELPATPRHSLGILRYIT